MIDFALFIFTPDDLATIRNNKEQVVRDNVLFEMGIFIGAIGKKRSFMLKPRNEEIHLPTDLLGLIPADYDANRTDDNLAAATNQACTLIKERIDSIGFIDNEKKYYGVNHILHSFPRDDFKLKIENSKSKIRFFNTWVPCLEEFESSIIEALIRGVDVEILLLHPNSPIVELRDKTLRDVNDSINRPYKKVEESYD